MTDYDPTGLTDPHWRVVPGASRSGLATGVLLVPLAFVVLFLAVWVLPDRCGRDHPDQDALVALYEATDGANWTNNENWLSSRHISEWYGVTFWRRGVWTLKLSNNGLRGTIPGELGTLASLEVLDLSHNALSGPIPAELGGLTELSALDLSNNRLSGPIPAELSGLNRLRLEQNDLSGCIPSDLRKVPTSDLAWLSLPFCGVAGLPVQGDPDSDREALVALYEATGGPDWNRSGDWLTDSPIIWWEGVGTDGEGRVTVLSLEDNRLSGAIPRELGSLTHLRSLNLHGNMLSGPIPLELGALASLRSLNLGDNNLSGPIPARLGALASLRFLNLSDNDLTGPIPHRLGVLELYQLHISGNQLSGCIPGNLRDAGSHDLAELGLPYCE